MNTGLDDIFVLASYSLRAFAALFWGAFLLFYRRRATNNVYLGVIFLIIGLLYLRNGFLRVPTIEPCDVYNVQSYLLLVFIAPFTIFYLYYAVGEKYRIEKKLMHFIPFAAMFGAWLLIRSSSAERIPFCNSIEDIFLYSGSYPVYSAFFLLLMTVFAAQVIAYFSIALATLISIRRTYRKHVYPTGPVDKLIAMDFLFLVYPLLCMVFMSYNNNVAFGIAHNFIAAAEITAISILGMNLILPLKTWFDFAVGIGGKELVIQNGTDSMCEQIVHMFTENEVHRLPRFTVGHLAERLGSNRTYVSSCINAHFGCSFSHLLKIYRIATARELLQNSDMSIKEIVWESGFGTRTSFYNAFREMVDPDLPPSEWRAIRKS